MTRLMTAIEDDFGLCKIQSCCPALWDPTYPVISLRSCLDHGNEAYHQQRQQQHNKVMCSSGLQVDIADDLCIGHSAISCGVEVTRSIACSRG